MNLFVGYDLLDEPIAGDASHEICIERIQLTIQLVDQTVECLLADSQALKDGMVCKYYVSTCLNARTTFIVEGSLAFLLCSTP